MKPKQFLIKYGTRFVIAVAVLAVIVGAGASSRNGKAGLFKNADGSLKAPVQKAASAVVDWIESLYGYIYTYDSLVAENETLRAENAQIREQVRNYEEVDAENVRLRELLNLKQKHSDFVFVSAKIVSWDPSDYTSIFSVSKGSEDGIEVGDCVLTEYGTLVGQVFELGDTWCNIRTIIDVDMDLGALAGENTYAGMIMGDFTLMKQNKTSFSYLTSGTQIFKGDEIITSGKGGVFPRGIYVGTIESVVTQNGGQTVYGIVNPAANISNLSQVFIVTDFDIVE